MTFANAGVSDGPDVRRSVTHPIPASERTGPATQHGWSLDPEPSPGALLLAPPLHPGTSKRRKARRFGGPQLRGTRGSGGSATPSSWHADSRPHVQARFVEPPHSCLSPHVTTNSARDRGVFTTSPPATSMV